MSKRYKARNSNAIYFITVTIIDWIDLFSRPIYKHIITDSLNHCVQNKGLIIHAYVIMSNHIHCIVSTTEDQELQYVMRDFKKFTSYEIIKTMKNIHESRSEWVLDKFSFSAKKSVRNTFYKVWQEGYHPIELNQNHLIDQKLNYIHNNPIRSEYVFKPEEYKFSSASDYNGIKGLVDIVLIE